MSVRSEVQLLDGPSNKQAPHSFDDCGAFCLCGRVVSSECPLWRDSHADPRGETFKPGGDGRFAQANATNVDIRAGLHDQADLIVIDGRHVSAVRSKNTCCQNPGLSCGINYHDLDP